MKHVEIDLHGLRHHDVEATLANEFFWKKVKTAEVITGNSVKMKKIVRNRFKKNKKDYVEYVHKASYFVQQ